jgi:hypothetical protein
MVESNFGADILGGKHGVAKGRYSVRLGLQSEISIVRPQMHTGVGDDG